LGFKARRSWRLAPIEVCTIAEERLVAALPLLRRLAAPFFEHPKSAPTLHVTVTDTGLDIDISGVERRKDGLSADARARAAEIAGEGDIARVTMAGETLYQARPALIRMGKATVALPPGGFLQAVAAAEQAMVDFALQASLGARRVADLYCGVGAFTFPLAGLAPVMAADASAPAVASLRAALATAPGLSPIEAAVRDLDRRPVLADELRKIDVVLFDPPRAGAAAQSAEIARSKVPRAIAVSCNLTTFVRDARILIEGGFELERILPVDQFLWSPHIELVGLFNR
jgi:23S rRNA (uracil1939-C5)-methyltransferase